MKQSLGDHLFTFAVISDSHVNEAEDRSASPFASNRLANGRLRYVVASLNQRHSAFTVHLGDMGNPLPELATYEDAAANFKNITGHLESPLYLVPGNHCVGDKPCGWVPVPRVSKDSLETYETIYGKCTYAFDHGPCHFVVLNSLLINSGLDREREQRRWLEEDLKRATESRQRPFVMMHYPPYVAARREPDSYDNLDEPGRSWLLGLFERFGVEAVYTGHVHNYFYNRFATTHLYTLPATSFVRQDYSELFRVGPADAEGGRDDVAKLGYLLVRVYEHGHLNELIRTHGRVLDEGKALESKEHLEVAGFRPAFITSLGTEMRDNWLSREALRPNNSVSPFTRRHARNDWAMAALEEMGVSKVRMALQELVKPEVASRMAPLQSGGFEFTAFSHGIPGESEYDAIRQHRSLLAAWELMLTRDELDVMVARLSRQEGGLAGDPTLLCYLNEVRDVSTDQIDDANVKHVANYGFQLVDRERIELLLSSGGIQPAFAGLVFRLRRRGESVVDLLPAIREIGELGTAFGMRHQVHVLFSGNVTSERFEDDLASANRVAEATLATTLAGNVDLYFDTFEDVDRGYFVRNGLVDRRYNPRLPARVLRHLNAALAELGVAGAGLETFSVLDMPGGNLVSGVSANRPVALVLPRPRCELLELGALDTGVRDRTRDLTVIALETGEVSRVGVKASDPILRLKEALVATSPLLVIGAE